METTIKHKYNIGDVHYDFNKKIDKKDTYKFYISGITNVDNKVFYELSDIKGNKENIQSYHFGRWLIAEEDIIPNFDQYVLKRKRLLNKFVNETTQKLLDKSPVYKNDIDNYYKFTIEIIDEIVPDIFDTILESQLEDVKRIKKTDYYWLAKMFTHISIGLFISTITLFILLIIK